jgi:hypothetical protein
LEKLDKRDDCLIGEIRAKIALLFTFFNEFPERFVDFITYRTLWLPRPGVINFDFVAV